MILKLAITIRFKVLILVLFLYPNYFCEAQFGIYKNAESTIILNEDSSFHYSFTSHIIQDNATGEFVISRDTIRLDYITPEHTTVTLVDTLEYQDPSNSEHTYPYNHRTYYQFPIPGSAFRPHILVHRKNKLFVIDPKRKRPRTIYKIQKHEAQNLD